MKFWPVPESFNEVLPMKGSPGSFGEEKDNGISCGVDIFCKPNSDVIAIESGIVVDTGLYSRSSIEDYFNDTYYVIIKNGKINMRYGGLREQYLKPGTNVMGGDPLGFTGEVINLGKISPNDPFYIRELAYKEYCSFLHIEIYKAPIMEIKPYKTGIYLGMAPLPYSIIDPLVYLSGLNKSLNF